MAYNPTIWKDRNVQFPRRGQLVDNGDGTYMWIPEPGTIYEPGTPVNAANMNKIEQAIAGLDVDVAFLLDAISGAGIGDSGPPVSPNLNDERTVGWRSYDLNTIGAPHTDISGFPNDGTVIVVRRLTNRVAQLAFGMAGNNAGRFAVRTLNSSGWGTWKEVFTTGNFNPNSKIDKSGGVSLGNFTIENGALRFTDGAYTRNVLSTWGGDSSGIGIHLGGAGGGIAIGAGESGGLIVANNSPTAENAYIGADSHVYFYSNLQNGWDVRKEAIWRNDGVLMLDGKRAMTRGDDPTAIIIPLLTSWYPFETSTSTAGATDAYIRESSPSGYSLTFYELVWNQALARGRNVYFEAMIGPGTSTSGTTYAAVRNKTNNTNLGQISFSGVTTLNRVRSGAITIPDGAVICPALWKSGGGVAQMLWARLVIQ